MNKVESFIHAINHADLERLCQLMTEDHVLIDSLGLRCQGREPVREAWRAYLSMNPDYTIEVRERFRRGPISVLLGAAHGTYSYSGMMHTEDGWSTPAAWRVELRGSQVACWQIFADNEPLRRILRKRGVFD